MSGYSRLLQSLVAGYYVWTNVSVNYLHTYSIYHLQHPQIITVIVPHLLIIMSISSSQLPSTFSRSNGSGISKSAHMHNEWVDISNGFVHLKLCWPKNWLGLSIVCSHVGGLNPLYSMIMSAMNTVSMAVFIWQHLQAPCGQTLGRLSWISLVLCLVSCTVMKVVKSPYLNIALLQRV